jgi:hypothetical protein
MFEYLIESHKKSPVKSYEALFASYFIFYFCTTNFFLSTIPLAVAILMI